MQLIYRKENKRQKDHISKKYTPWQKNKQEGIRAFSSKTELKFHFPGKQCL